MIATSVADRRYRISLWCLIVAVGLVVASPLGFYLAYLMSPKHAGWDGLENLVRGLLWALAGLIVAGCIALVSLGYGMACARERKRVLFWVVPLWLAAACGAISGLIQLLLMADEKLGFILGGKRDDMAVLLAIWMGSFSLLSLAYWIASVVCGLRFRWFPLWSVPLWSIAVLCVMIIFG